jgi:hypothetical protein
MMGMQNLKLFFLPFMNRSVVFSFIITMVFLSALYLLQIQKNLLFLVILLLFCFSLYLSWSRKSEHFVVGILSGIATIVIAYYFYQSGSNFTGIVEWDFLAFYVYGKAGADGLALYDPGSFTNILTAIQFPNSVSSAFNASIIQVGVCYPPTTMLLLTPLGYLDLSTANVVWRIFVLSFLIIDIVLIYRIFKLNESKWIQALIVVVLTMALPGSSTTVALSQTNFFLLFFILLIYKDPDNWKAGMYLAIAIVVKPIAAVWGLYFLINRKWKPIFSFTITGILLVLTTIVWFGLDNFVTFFTSPPTSRIPGEVFIETINQSMYAVFSRISLQFGMNSLFNNVNWIVLSVTVILVILACIASYKFSKKKSIGAFLVFLPLSLLIYPGCLMHYAVQLLPLFLSMIQFKDKTSLVLLTIFLIALSFSSFASSFIILSAFIIYAFLGIPAFTKLKTYY